MMSKTWKKKSKMCKENIVMVLPVLFDNSELMMTTVNLWRCAPYKSFPLGSFLKDCSMPRERGEKSWMHEIKANHVEDCVVESVASRSGERTIPPVQHRCLVSCFLTVWNFPAEDYQQKTIPLYGWRAEHTRR